MPQPVHFSSRAITVDFSPKAILQRRDLSHYPSLISAHWNDLEARIAVLMAALLKEEARTVVTIFVALTGDAPKRAFVDAVIGMKLNAESRARFVKIQEEIGSRYSERNTVVHGAWGISPEFPDKLLWGDARDSISLMPDIMDAKTNPQAMRARLIEVQQKLFVWSDHDFRELVARMEATRRKFDEFADPYLAQHFDPKKEAS